MKRLIWLLILTITLSGCLGRQKEAEEHYRKAKEYIEKRDVDNSIFHLEKALECGISDPAEIYAMLGALYAMKGLKTQARKSFEGALEEYGKLLQLLERANYSVGMENTKKSISRVEDQLKKLE